MFDDLDSWLPLLSLLLSVLLAAIQLLSELSLLK